MKNFYIKTVFGNDVEERVERFPRIARAIASLEPKDYSELVVTEISENEVHRMKRLDYSKVNGLYPISSIKTASIELANSASMRNTLISELAGVIYDCIETHKKKAKGVSKRSVRLASEMASRELVDRMVQFDTENG